MESLPPVTQLEDRLQNGVVLCKLGMKLLPLDSMWKKVYDLEETRYKVCVCWEGGGGECGCILVYVGVCVCGCGWVCVGGWVYLHAEGYIV